MNSTSPSSCDTGEVRLAYYIGAYGPTIRIMADSAEGLLALREVFVDLARRRCKEIALKSRLAVTDLSRPEVSLILELLSEESRPSKRLARGESPSGLTVFRWAAHSEIWWECVGLVDGLYDSAAPGHQYLTLQR